MSTSKTFDETVLASCINNLEEQVVHHEEKMAALAHYVNQSVEYIEQGFIVDVEAEITNSSGKLQQAVTDAINKQNTTTAELYDEKISELYDNVDDFSEDIQGIVDDALEQTTTVFEEFNSTVADLGDDLNKIQNDVLNAPVNALETISEKTEKVQEALNNINQVTAFNTTELVEKVTGTLNLSVISVLQQHVTQALSQLQSVFDAFLAQLAAFNEKAQSLNQDLIERITKIREISEQVINVIEKLTQLLEATQWMLA